MATFPPLKSQPPVEMLHERVLLKRVDPAQKIGSLHVVQSSKSNEGIVVAVGPGGFDPDFPNFRRPMTVKPGDHVLFGQYAGFEWGYLGETYIVCREDDLCLVLRDNPVV